MVSLGAQDTEEERIQEGERNRQWEKILPGTGGWEMISGSLREPGFMLAILLILFLLPEPSRRPCREANTLMDWEIKG